MSQVDDEYLSQYRTYVVYSLHLWQQQKYIYEFVFKQVFFYNILNIQYLF